MLYRTHVVQQGYSLPHVSVAVCDFSLIDTPNSIQVVTMDIILLGSIAVVVVVLILSLLYSYQKQRSYDEAIEEQRRRNEEEREKARQEKKIEKENKKKFKKKDKAGKEKAPQTPEPDAKEPKMVNLEIDPEIIEPTQDVGVTAKAKPSKGSKKQKPILTNKNEKPLVTETKEAKEMPHKPVVPKDEVELKHVHEQITSKVQPPVEQAVKGGKKQGEAKQTKAKEPVVEEKVVKPQKVTAEYAALQTQPAKSSKSATGKFANCHIIFLSLGCWPERFLFCVFLVTCFLAGLCLYLEVSLILEFPGSGNDLLQYSIQEGL